MLQLILRSVLLGVLALAASAALAGDASYADGVKAYLNGDYSQALKIWTVLADEGDNVAMFNIGVLTAQGLGGEADPVAAAAWYRKSAEAGYAAAQFNLGEAYRTGTGVGRNPALAVEWMEKSARNGHRPAEYNVGLMYWAGEGVAQDKSRAVEWFRKAAADGDQQARAMLTRIGAASPTPAVESAGEVAGTAPASNLPESAAAETRDQSPADGRGREGWIFAQKPNRLTIQVYADRTEQQAQAFLDKFGRESESAYFKSNKPGKPWFKVIVGSFGSRRNAASALAGLSAGVKRHSPWIRSFSGVQKEVDKSFHSQRSAAAAAPSLPTVTPPVPAPAIAPSVAAGEASAAGKASPAAPGDEATSAKPVTAGEQRIIEFNQGQRAFSSRDYAAALRIWEPLARQGLAEAQYGVGFLYEQGWGVVRSAKTAFEWYQRAAEQGHPKAQYSLGRMYLDGRGVIANDGLGLYWIQTAANNREPRAIQYLKDYREG